MNAGKIVLSASRAGLGVNAEILMKQPIEVAQIGETQPVSSIRYGVAALLQQESSLFHTGFLEMRINAIAENLFEQVSEFGLVHPDQQCQML